MIMIIRILVKPFLNLLQSLNLSMNMNFHVRINLFDKNFF